MIVSWNSKLHMCVRYFRSSLALRVVTVDVDDTSNLTATLLQEIPGNVPWYMTDSIVVLEDGYSEVVVNHQDYGWLSH